MNELPYLGGDVFGEVTLDALTVKVLLEFLVTELVAGLKFAIVIEFLLNSVVSQVDIPVGNILQCEFS